MFGGGTAQHQYVSPVQARTREQSGSSTAVIPAPDSQPVVVAALASKQSIPVIGGRPAFSNNADLFDCSTQELLAFSVLGPGNGLLYIILQSNIPGKSDTQGVSAPLPALRKWSRTVFTTTLPPINLSRSPVALLHETDAASPLVSFCTRRIYSCGGYA